MCVGTVLFFTLHDRFPTYMHLSTSLTSAEQFYSYMMLSVVWYSTKTLKTGKFAWSGNILQFFLKIYHQNVRRNWFVLILSKNQTRTSVFLENYRSVCQFWNEYTSRISQPRFLFCLNIRLELYHRLIVGPTSPGKGRWYKEERFCTEKALHRFN